MKAFSRTTLALTTLLTLSTTLLACGTNPIPQTPSPSASPSGSASPIPTAPPSASPEATPTPSLSPTPEPTVTPFPVGTPAPSNTPLPTPTPIFGASPSPGSTQNVTVQFRARVITDGREVLPVSRTEFRATPYNLAQVQEQVAARNGVESKPQPPSQNDAKYQLSEKVCTSSGCTTRSSVDTAAYQEDLTRYTSSVLPDWERRAYNGLEDAIASISNERTPTTFTTDANGEASLNLATGSWYFSGRYTVNGTVVVWESIPFEITSTTRTLELTR
ncbi:MAG: hypothetical protein ACO1RX_04100 [Candidatus Sericytochromatia bacterium]